MQPDLIALLRSHAVHPSPQRVAIAEYVLATDEHPAADQVLERVQRRMPVISRETGYNTLRPDVAALAG